MRKAYVVVLLKRGHDHWNRELFFLFVYLFVFS